MTGTGRIAVILFNLGGPDRLSAVRPFLFNLFNDPAILGLPMPVRPALAWLLASRRAGPATEIYRQLGGASPLLDNTLAQARALEAALAGPPGLGAQFRTFVAMRYWHPFAREVVKAVKVFDPERILLLPLYPQWSTTTTASSFRAWRQACRRIGLDRPTSSVCCYPVEPGFVTAIATLIRERLPQAALHGRPRVLFSAHGLPRRVIDRGDPYQWQCEQTAAAIAAAVGSPDLEWVNCYQSRVGPLEWIGPATDAEITRAGRDRRPVLVVPIAFVSEHSETLVELDIEYRGLAERCGVPAYLRVPTVGVTPTFIDGLATLIRTTVAKAGRAMPAAGEAACPPIAPGCGWRSEAMQKGR
jgi:ferrochelatase